MDRPAWHAPVDPAARAWIERASGPGWRVVRVGRMRGGIAAAVDGVGLVGPGGATRRLVLKRWLRPGWETDDAEFTAAREAEVLGRLAGTPVPVPEVVALDADGSAVGAPTVLMTHVEGRHPSLAEERRPDRIATMARTLVAIHAVDAGMQGVIDAFRFYEPLDAVAVPPAAPTPGLWRAAIDRVRGQPPTGPGVLLHRDYHPWNTLWQGRRLVGVVDWTNASWGRPAMDLAHWRANLGTVHGVEVADLVVDAYSEAGGSAEDQAWWDVRILLDFLGDEDWSGPHALPVAEAYLEALLRRL